MRERVPQLFLGVYPLANLPQYLTFVIFYMAKKTWIMAVGLIVHKTFGGLATPGHLGSLQGCCWRVDTNGCVAGKQLLACHLISGLLITNELYTDTEELPENYINYSKTTKTTYCLSTFRLYVRSLHQDWHPVPQSQIMFAMRIMWKTGRTPRWLIEKQTKLADS